MAALSVAALASTAVVAPGSSPVHATTASPDVSGWAPYWTPNTSLGTLTANAAIFSEISPFWSSTTDENTIITNASISAATVQSYLKLQPGARVVPTLVDATPPLPTGSPNSMAVILADPARRATMETTIINWVTQNGYDGVDLDFENFAFSDGRASWPTTHDAWVAFIWDLFEQLHAQGKTLEVSVPPIYKDGSSSDSGYWVYAYPSMANHVDRIKVMAYEYSGSKPGPMAPLSWDATILNAIAAAGVPAADTVLGIPAYGKDWVTSIAGSCPAGITPGRKSVTSKFAPTVAFNHGVVPQWDSTNSERTFSYYENFSGKDANGWYVSCNVYRTVWFMDANGMSARVALAKQHGIVGVSFWALGGEEASAWAGINAAINGTTSWTAAPYAVPAPAPAPPSPVYSPDPNARNPLSVDHFSRTWGVNSLGNPEKFWIRGSQVWHSYSNGSTWSTDSPVGGPPGGIVSAEVGNELNYLNNQELYVVAGDHNVYHDFATPGRGSGWSGWSTMSQPSGTSIAGEVRVSRNYLNNQELYVLGTDGEVYHKFATPGIGTGWSNWDPMGHPEAGIAGDVHVSRNYLNNQELYVVGKDGIVYHKFSTPGVGTGWSNWDPMGGIGVTATANDVAVWRNWFNNQELFILGNSNQIWHNFSTPGAGTGWSGWTPITAPPGVQLANFVGLDEARPLKSLRLWVQDTDGNYWYANSILTGTGWSGWTNWGPNRPSP